jgi:hypothetical protein
VSVLGQVARQRVRASLPPFDPEPNFCLSHTIHRWLGGIITLAIPSPRIPLPNAPPSFLHPVTSRSHLLRHSIHTFHTHNRRSHHALSPPAVTLAQPATEPPIPASSRLVLRSPKLPWVVVIGPIGSPPSFFIGIRKDDKKRKFRSSAALPNLDVLYAVHSTPMTCVTPKEWYSLGEHSRASAVLRRRIRSGVRAWEVVGRVV